MIAKIEIFNGPSRENLRDSLGSRSDYRIKVEFTLDGQASDVAKVHPLPLNQDAIKLVAVVNGMEWEDGSGESWNLKCYAVSVVGATEGVGLTFSAYYDTRNRRGCAYFKV